MKGPDLLPLAFLALLLAFITIALAACATKKEVRSVTDATGTTQAKSSATENRQDTKVSRETDNIRQGPVETTITTTIKTEASANRPARQVTRVVHQVVAPREELTQSSSTENEKAALVAAGELDEMRKRLATSDLQQSSKPSLGIGARIILLVAALAVVALAVGRKYLAARFGWLSWLVKR